MAKPTQKLAKRAEELLGQPVEFAVRVSYGPVGSQGHPILRWIWNVFTLPGRLLSIVTGRSKDKYLSDSEGAFAFMGDGSYAVLSTSRRSTLLPVELDRRFPMGAPLKVEKNLLAESLFFQFTIDGFTATMHRADAKALLRAAETGAFTRPVIVDLVPLFLNYMNSGLVSENPLELIDGRAPQSLER